MKLTLDVGGSKTRGFLYAESVVEQIEICGGFGKAEDVDGIESTLLLALKKRFGDNCDKITAVAVNLGGKNKGQILRTVATAFPFAKISIYRESEGVLAKRIMRAQNANILVMAGTGCIVFAQSLQGCRVLGGWGKDYGDDGSGYSVGIKAVRYCLKDLDSGNEKTSLLTKALFGVEKPFNFQKIDEYAAARDEARSRIPKTREGVAALTRVVTDCAEQGCALSKTILQETGKEIAELVLTAVRASKIDTPSVAVNGGVTNFFRFWQDSFLHKLRTLEKEVSVVCLNDGIDQALKQTVEEM